ncbi:MgtC/SapB family protein [Flavobacterium sp. CBA20B-1]|uniref:MgtC/SapB family protein n=1 Tax=Paenimyroides aestuarii TaxID=2968490 RepID=A0ABY5NSU6_9FLAO|nr:MULTISPECIES: MgtC/SapB family protein [Flavobacteriaceae]UUV21650.1 MgtC/SapB family protein [Paenimyroides aestuarii]WCM41881.1 MgtC/SapB family protein [Flavobacterium sp. CBA20B-1]
MDFTTITDYWQLSDLLKASFSLLVGMLLGAERELKDKAAGLRTITLICLGSTLFTLLSYKLGMGDSEDATRIASYVVSGIGFLGAGVIFKDAFSINGLTTASIIWIAAAIGMSIGFGQFYTALTFLACSFFIIHLGGFVNKHLLTMISLKRIEIQIDKIHYKSKPEIETNIKMFCKQIELKQLHELNGIIILNYECKAYTKKIHLLEDYLVYNTKIQSFKM